jgi:hypothetical protein
MTMPTNAEWNGQWATFDTSAGDENEITYYRNAWTADRPIKLLREGQLVRCRISELPKLFDKTPMRRLHVTAREIEG